jgi:branched-chain amino acid transport system ATP-binding protein
MSGGEVLLEVSQLSASYGDLQALRSVSIIVRKGEAVGIIGPNGAGKSTMLATIAGGVRSQAGRVRLGGMDIVGLRAERIARMGLSLVPEGRHIFSTLTVRENLFVGTYMRRKRSDVAQDLERVLGYFPRLRERIDYPAGRLSGGEQQMLAIARGLMTRPRIMLIDEPSLGLAPLLVAQIYEILFGLRQSENLTLLINEQNSNRIVTHTDRIYVLRSGQVKLEGETAGLRDGTEIRRAYFGFGEIGNAPGAEPANA